MYVDDIVLIENSGAEILYGLKINHSIDDI